MLITQTFKCFRAGFQSEIVILHKRLRTKLVITDDGHCTWQAPVTLNSYCTLNVADFPFDEQKCPVEIGSWTYPGEKINITYFDRNADLSHYVKSGEWTLQSATLSQDFGFYTPENTLHPHVTLSLKIKRRPGYYKNQIIIPLAAISIMAIYSFLPLNVEDRIMIVITIVVAVSVYGVVVSSALPETSDATPALQKYCLAILLLVVCSSAHVIIPYLLQKRLPRWLRCVGKRFGIKCSCTKSKNNARNRSRAAEHELPTGQRQRDETLGRGSANPTVEGNAAPASETGGESSEMDAEMNQGESVSGNREDLDERLEENNHNKPCETLAFFIRIIFGISFLVFFVVFYCCWAS